MPNPRVSKTHLNELLKRVDLTKGRPTGYFWAVRRLLGIRLYNSPLLCGFNVPVEGLINETITVEHVSDILSSRAGLPYAVRLLRSHGIKSAGGVSTRHTTLLFSQR